MIASGGSVAVGIEEFSHGCAVLWEVNVVTARVPLLIVIDHVVGLGCEKLCELFVLEDLIKNPHLIDGGLCALISDSSESGEGEEAEVHFPNESLVEHQESESSVCNHGAGPAVVGSVQAGIDLVEVIRCAHSPLPEVVLEDVVAVSELVGVALGLGGFGAVGSVDVGPIVHVLVIKTLRGAESEVVVAWGGGLSETSDGGGNKAGGLLYLFIC